jgi:hypothetical protein
MTKLEKWHTLKGAASQAMQEWTQYSREAGCGNTPYEGKGYYHDRLYGDTVRKPILQIATIMNEAQFQPQLTGVTLLVKSSPEIAGSAHRG